MAPRHYLILLGLVGLLATLGVACSEPGPTLPSALSAELTVGSTPNAQPTDTSALTSNATSAAPASRPPVSAPPVASFSVDVQSGMAPVMVQFENTSSGATSSVEWDFGDGDASTDLSPTHRYTIAGSYTVRLKIFGPGGTDTTQMSDLITVSPGPPFSLEVSPSEFTLAVKEGTQFTTVALDEFGNEIPLPATNEWVVVAGGGSIDADGRFTAATRAGSFKYTISAYVPVDSGKLEAAASVTVEPGPLSKLLIEPTEVTLNIGATQAFSFSVLDQFGNEIPDALSSWSTPTGSGGIDAEGVFTSGTKAGRFPGGIKLDVVKGTDRASATVTLDILHDPLASVDVEPAYVFVERGDSQKFNASAFDQYGNVLPALAFLWEATGGFITQEGVFTAGEDSGSYAVKSAATHDKNSSAGSATVLVSPYMKSSYELQKASIQVERYGIRSSGSRGFVSAVGYADFDKDGDVDVLMSSGDSSPNRSTMEFYRNNSGSYTKDNSIFAEAVPGMVHPRKMLVGDYNSDGWPDAFVIGHGYDQPPWPGEYPILLLSDGEGKLVATPYDQVISFQHGGASADIDHDNDLDIFVIDNQGTSFFLMNDGAGIFSYDTDRVPSGARGFTAELIDVDEDGFIDLVTAGHEFQGHPVVIFWGKADGRFSNNIQTRLPNATCWGTVIDIEAEDLDGDGDRDIVLNRTSGGCDTFYKGFYVQVLRNDGNRSFTDATDTMIVDGSSPTGRWIDWLRIQDINGDGRLELIADDASIRLIWINQDGILRR